GREAFDHPAVDLDLGRTVPLGLCRARRPGAVRRDLDDELVGVAAHRAVAALTDALHALGREWTAEGEVAGHDDLIERPGRVDIGQHGVERVQVAVSIRDHRHPHGVPPCCVLRHASYVTRHASIFPLTPSPSRTEPTRGEGRYTQYGWRMTHDV